MADGLRFRTARDLFEGCPAARADITATPDGQPSLEFCRALLAGRVPEEAITFCAYLLPERASVWWGHECLGHLADCLDDSDIALLALVREWVGDPDNPDHRSALAAVPSNGARTPGAWLALAAASGAEADLPRPNACGIARCVNASILAALARVAVAERAEILQAFAEMGMQLAEIEALREKADTF